MMPASEVTIVELAQDVAVGVSIALRYCDASRAPPWPGSPRRPVVDMLSCLAMLEYQGVARVQGQLLPISRIMTASVGGAALSLG